MNIHHSPKVVLGNGEKPITVQADQCSTESIRGRDMACLVLPRPQVVVSPRSARALAPAAEWTQNLEPTLKRRPKFSRNAFTVMYCQTWPEIITIGGHVQL